MLGSLESGRKEKTGIKISKEWVNSKVTSFGHSRKKQLASLSKKMFGHKGSADHKVAQKVGSFRGKKRNHGKSNFETAFP